MKGFLKIFNFDCVILVAVAILEDFSADPHLHKMIITSNELLAYSYNVKPRNNVNHLIGKTLKNYKIKLIILSKSMKTTLWLLYHKMPSIYFHLCG